MKVDAFVKLLGSDFYTGVPDSQLKPLCNYLMSCYGISEHHVIAANEGNATALATGHYLATGRPGVVYMQNSGVGNIINPVTSLTSPDVYGIPVIYVVGWRGEPGVHDEPQHVQMGKVTELLLNDVGIETFVIGKDTQDLEIEQKILEWKPLLEAGESVAFIVRKDALSFEENTKYQNDYTLKRERALEVIAQYADGPIVCTTGKSSRELFEVRETRKEKHTDDFLTVGSMGHCSSIALGIALAKPTSRVYAIDGDGSAMMHMGAIATIGNRKPKNFVHIVLNNSAHETVGGMPTSATTTNLCQVAEACGYTRALKVRDENALKKAFETECKCDGPVFIEVCVAIGSRANLGRPTIAPQECKLGFMENIAL